MSSDKNRKPAKPPSSHQPAVTGALPKPGGHAPLKTPPLLGNLFSGVSPPVIPPEQGTRPGVVPQPTMTIEGRATLLLDSSSVPPTTDPDESSEAPPIVVPASGATAPQAVTQPPPWSDDAVRLNPSIPKASETPKESETPAEEISASLLVPDEEAAGEAQPRVAPSKPPPPRPSASRSVPPPLPSAALSVPRSPPPPPRFPPATQSASAKPKSLPPPPPITTVADSTPPPPPGVDDIPPPAPPTVAPPTGLFPFPSPPASVASPGAVPAEAPPNPKVASPATLTSAADASALPALPVAPPPPSLAERLAPARAAFKRAVATVHVVAMRAGQNLQTISPRRVLLSSPRPPWAIPALAATMLVVGVVVTSLFAAILRRPKGEGQGQATVASSSASRAASSAPEARVVLPPPAVPPPMAACNVTGSSQAIAPSAVLSAGVEAVRLGDDVAFGFAAGDLEAAAVRVDAASLAVKASIKAKSAEAVRRATPLLKGGAFAVAVDADRKDDRVQGRRTVPASPPLQLGMADASLVWAKMGRPPAGKLWGLDGAGPVEALRGSPEEGTHVLAVAFRRNGSVWLGTAEGDGSLAVQGDLTQILGLGPTVGSPAIAIGGGSILAAWADRSPSDTGWHLRLAHFSAGEAPSGASSFDIPAGGKGENAMSPGIAALPGRRFLLVWTEGPVSGHDVRALTVSSDGSPIGTPLLISTPGVNAGAGQAAVNAEGRGAVAFLSAAGENFGVTATPIDCGP